MKKRMCNLSRVYRTKSRSWNNENAIDFNRSSVKEEDEEDIALVNLIDSLQKQTDEEIFPKSN